MYIDEEGGLTEEFREALPERLGDAYYNDPETKQQPTKELDNVKNVFDLAKMVVNGSRTISKHGDQLKNATKGMVKIPGEGATDEELAAYRKAMGVPDTPDAYELAVPDGGDKEGFESIAKEVKAAAHEAGIAPSKLSAVWGKVVNAIAAQTQALEQKGMELLNADVQALKEAKKEKYDSFIADTNRVAQHFDTKGIDGTPNPIGTNFMVMMEKMGIRDTPVVREFLGAIAPLVLEGKTVVGGTAPDKQEGVFSYKYDENGRPI